ncbi:MAG: thiamine biosynthesis protein ThiS [Thermoplasmatota archaeon]
MHVTVTFKPRRQPDREVEVPAGATVGALLASLSQAPESTLVVRGETPITESEKLVSGETLLLLSAFSGG